VNCPAERTDDPAGDGVGQPKWSAECDHALTDPQTR
jgi:hypothetical protein